jgi:GDPmannose 4,6-dehydratase
MLQQDEPDDYVIASGTTHSVREFVEAVFDRLDLDWKKYIEIDPRYFRPAEVDILLGDARKARKKLNWRPSVTFNGLVDLMVEADLELARKEAHLNFYHNPGDAERIHLKNGRVSSF